MYREMCMILLLISVTTASNQWSWLTHLELRAISAWQD